jgi:limonene-1,2-epoxide hydrolase
MNASAEDTVRRFCAAWPNLNVDEVTAFFTDDIVYHNMPGPPLEGLAAVRAGIESFLKTWQGTEFVILAIASSGNTVLTERIDRIDSGGRHVDLPVAGVFEVEGGKIRAWRDYFDLATYTRAMSPS